MLKVGPFDLLLRTKGSETARSRADCFGDSLCHANACHFTRRRAMAPKKVQVPKSEYNQLECILSASRNMMYFIFSCQARPKTQNQTTFRCRCRAFPSSPVAYIIWLVLLGPHLQHMTFSPGTYYMGKWAARVLVTVTPFCKICLGRLGCFSCLSWSDQALKKREDGHKNRQRKM